MNLRGVLAFLLTHVIAVTASAVLIDGLNGALDVAPFPEPVLDHIGVRGGLSAIYLGNGIVLTANHCGPGDVWFGGQLYHYVPGSAVRLVNDDGTYADLMMFEVHPRPNLPELPIVSSRPLVGSVVKLAGNGFDRGPSLVWDPNGSGAPGPTGGYAWAPSSSVRWGHNVLEVVPTARVFNTIALGTIFHSGLLWPEAQAVTGDSGGGVFALTLLGGWQLAGVMIGITQYAGQPPNTSFYGQKTYFADAAYYRPQLVDAVDLPEPGGALGAGAALLFLLACKRREAARAARRSGAKAKRWPPGSTVTRKS